MISKNLYHYIVSDILFAVISSHFFNIKVKSHIFKYLINYFENLGIFELEFNEVLNIVFNYKQNEELLDVMNEIFSHHDITYLITEEYYCVYFDTEDYVSGGFLGSDDTYGVLVESIDDSMSCIYWKYCSNLDLISQSVLIF